jgi:hypothetical protein
MKSKDNFALLIDIVEITISFITDETNVIWADYDTPQDLLKNVKRDLKALENGDLARLDKLKNYFLPTGTFQEVAISNGWSDEYLELSEEFDRLYNLIKSEQNKNIIARSFVKLKNNFISRLAHLKEQIKNN